MCPQKCLKLNQSRNRNSQSVKPGNLKFCATLNEWTLIGRELTRREKEKKEGIKHKLKVSTLEIQIKRSGLKVSYPKVPSSKHSINALAEALGLFHSRDQSDKNIEFSDLVQFGNCFSRIIFFFNRLIFSLRFYWYLTVRRPSIKNLEIWTFSNFSSSI